MFDRITIDAERMGGVPCIRGLRIPVSTLIAMLAEGMSQHDILAGSIIVINEQRIRIRRLPILK